jgi:hypothetical protein
VSALLTRYNIAIAERWWCYTLLYFIIIIVCGFSREKLPFLIILNRDWSLIIPTLLEYCW